jgi:hypothetical protein
MLVSNVAELKQAMQLEVDVIEITDGGLAQKVRLVKTATGPVVAAIIAVGGIAAANFWNPVGVMAGTAGFVAEASLFAAVARFKPATPTRQKVATHSHFNVATLRRAGVRDEPVIDNARNSNAASRQYPQSRLPPDHFAAPFGMTNALRSRLFRFR